LGLIRLFCFCFFFHLLFSPSFAKVVGKLFELLDSDERDKRRNALTVLRQLCAHGVANMTSHFRERIAQHLLARLQDEELALRVDAAALFGRLDLSVIVPDLCTKARKKGTPFLN
jgi:hypothetical protein